MVSKSELHKRFKKEIEPGILIWCIIITLAGAVLFNWGTQLLIIYYRQAHLLESGIRTEGIVIEKKEERKPKLEEIILNVVEPRYKVTLKFITADGKEVEAIAQSSKKEFEELSLGDTVSLLYAPKNPHIITITFSPEDFGIFIIILMCYSLFLASLVPWRRRWLHTKNKLYLCEHGIESIGLVKNLEGGLGLYQIIFEVKSEGRKYRIRNYVSKEDFKYMSVGRIIKILIDPENPKRAMYLPDDDPHWHPTRR